MRRLSRGDRHLQGDGHLADPFCFFLMRWVYFGGQVKDAQRAGLSRSFGVRRRKSDLDVPFDFRLPFCSVYADDFVKSRTYGQGKYFFKILAFHRSLAAQGGGEAQRPGSEAGEIQGGICLAQS